MTIALDGSASAYSSSAVTHINASLTTGGSTDIIVAVVNVNSGQYPAFPAVRMSDAGGHVSNWQIAFTFMPNQGNREVTQVWWGTTTTNLSLDSIEATFPDGSQTGVSLIVFGVSGANLTHPFDLNASWAGTPTYNSNFGASTTINPLTTNSTAGMGIYIQAISGSAGASPSSGWTNIAAVGNIAANYMVYASALAGVTPSNGSIGSGTTSQFAFAFVAAAQTGGTTSGMPQIDSSSATTTINSSVTSGTVTLSTSLANDFIVLGIIRGQDANVSSVSSTNTSGWTQYTYIGSGTNFLDIWVGTSNVALSGEVITIEFENAITNGGLAAMAFTNPASSLGTEWDPGFTAAPFPEFSPATNTFSIATQNAPAMMFGITAGPSAGVTYSSSASVWGGNTYDTPIMLFGAWSATSGPNSEAYGNGGSVAFSVISPLVFPQPRAVTGTFTPTEHTDIMNFYEQGELYFDTWVSGGAQSGVTQCSVSLSTTYAEEIIGVFVTMGGFWSSSTVGSITDTQGLIWHRRNWRFEGDYSTEFWWAYAPEGLASDTITVNTASEFATTGAITMFAFGIAGANVAQPFDKSTMAGWFSYSGGTPQAQQSTEAAVTLQVAYNGNGGTSNGGLPMSDWVYVGTLSTQETNGYAMTGTLAHGPVNSAPVVNEEVLFNGGGGTLITDAFVAYNCAGTAQPIEWGFDSITPGQLAITISSADETSETMGFSTNYNNTMIIVPIAINSASGLGTVTSITDLESPAAYNNGAKLTWQRRSRTTDATGTLALEIWWAWAPIPTDAATYYFGDAGDTITINLAHTAIGDTIVAEAFAITGMTEGYYWDGHPSLPAVSHTNSGAQPLVTGMSTLRTDIVSMIFTANMVEAVYGAQGPGYFMPPTPVAPQLYWGSNAPNLWIGVEFMYSVPALANQSASFVTASPAPTISVTIGDAIMVGPPPPPTGAWGSIESDDVWSATGYPQMIGSWHSTENDDTFNGTPNQSPYFGKGWLGWVPCFGTMGVQENKDLMAFYGWILGLPVTGRMGAFEDRDRLAFSNYTGNGSCHGTFGATEHKDRFGSNGYEVPKVHYVPPPRKRRQLIVT